MMMQMYIVTDFYMVIKEKYRVILGNKTGILFISKGQENPFQGRMNGGGKSSS